MNHMLDQMLLHLPLFAQFQVPGILPWHLLAAQCRWESAFNPQARSCIGAAGLAQFMPKTWAQFGVGDRETPYEAIKAQAHYMLHLVKLMAQAKPDPILWALVAYTTGPHVATGALTFQDLILQVQVHIHNILHTSRFYRSAFSCPLASYPNKREFSP